MNPITRAMVALADEAEAYWRMHPYRLLPLVAHEDQQEDVIQALRLYEARPETRRPLVLWRAPFMTASSYFAGLASQIAIDFERVRAAVAERGVDLPAFVLGDDGTVPSGALKRAVHAMHQAARLLGERFLGSVVALVPEYVTDAAAWYESIRMLDAARGSPRVQVAVFTRLGSPLSEALGNEGALFHVDPPELNALAAPMSSAPESDAGRAPTEEVQEEHDVTTLPSIEARARLRALLLDASTALGVGGPLDAATVYREAHALCEAAGLREQKAEVLIAIGAAYVVAGVPELGVESYREAALGAEDLAAWSLACQAWLGLGDAYLRRERYAAAAAGFRMALAAAKWAQSVPLRIAAQRLTGTCLLRLGREHEAMLMWQDAVEAGAAADVAEREASTFYEVADGLVKLLESRGLDEQARHVRGRATRT